MFIHMDINKYIFTLLGLLLFFLFLRQRRRKDGLLPLQSCRHSIYEPKKKTIFPINIYLMVHYHTKERGDIVCVRVSPIWKRS